MHVVKASELKRAILGAYLLTGNEQGRQAAESTLAQLHRFSEIIREREETLDTQYDAEDTREGWRTIFR